MNESTLNKMIREHKARIIWFLVFLILAVFVTALVFGTLKRSVQAQTYTKRVFACSYAQEGAEPVAHQHNDDCYENGELICTLPERELHIHGDECYAEEKVLVCTLEEGEGHIHSDACYTEEPVLVCGQEEDLGHTHTDECYTEEQVLVCGLEENDGHVHSAENGCYTRVQGDLICTNEDPEHVHNDDCYAWEEVLTCEIPEGEGAHHHDEQCYETQRILSCGQEEREPGHIHSDECYETQRVLSCGMEEGEGAHTHDDTCYEIQMVLICDKEEVKTEHVHTVDCFQVVDMSPEEIHALHMSELPESDPTADVESPDVWESRFASVPLSGEWDRDLLKIAETQLGYTESQRNFEAVPDEYGDGYTLKGWTRYGAWYGIPYGDWCAMFISFCLNYADIPESAIPYDCATTTWIDSLSARGMYAPAGSYDPKPGDLIFFDWEGDGLSDHVGIVWAVNPSSITTIEGNHTISVELFDYDLSDGHIQGYGILPENLDLPTNNDVDSGNIEDGADAEAAEAGSADTAENSDNTDAAASADEQTEREAMDVSAENNNSDDSTSTDAESTVNMPPFKESRLVSGIRVTIEADEGAFPEGTTVEIKAIEDDDLAEQVAPVVNGKVVQVQAVDITFFDAEGNEIEPRIPIRVTMRPNIEAAEADGVEVVHLEDNGNVSTVETQDSVAQPDKGAAFDADSFSKYALVYILSFEYQVNGKTYSSSFDGGQNLALSDLLVQLGVCDENQAFDFVSAVDSVVASDPEVIDISKENGVWTIRPLKETEGSVTLTVTMKDDAKFSIQVQAQGATEVAADNAVISTVDDLLLPGNANASTEVLTEELNSDAVKDAIQAVEEIAAAPEENTVYQVFSINLENVQYSNYENGFQVDLKLPEGIACKDCEVYHIDNNGRANRLELLDTDAKPLTEDTELISAVSFVTPSFSDFVIRYTVDFHYKVNGNFYEFSFAGGSFVSLEKLLELIHITAEPTENAEPAETEIAEERVVFDDLSGINVSQETKDFVADIKNVTFSTPSLLWVGKAEEETTVGALKEANKLVCEYSAELTVDEIAAIDEQTVTAGDWALISLVPFSSEETLTIVMNDGQVFTIRVTDEKPNYVVRIKLDENANQAIPTDEHYFIYIKASYANGDTGYQFAPFELTVDDLSSQSHSKDYEFSSWLDQNGEVIQSGQNASFNGNERSIELVLLKHSSDTFHVNDYQSSVISTEGSAIKAYKISYDKKHEQNQTNCIDYIKLTTIDAEGEFTYSSVLGPNLYYGIVADHLYQQGHMQTTFAVNHYTGGGHDDRPDLSGNSGGSIVIAQYNEQGTSASSNYVGAAVHEAVDAGQLFVGSPLKGTLVVYVDQNSGSDQPIDPNGDNGKVKGNHAQTVVIQKDGTELSSSIVNPAISYGTGMSNTLALRTASFDPPIPSSGKLTLDTTAFDDDATIYINADRIVRFISSTGDLIINKKDNQTIVFNFNNEYKDGLWLKEYVVNGFQTHSPENKDSPDNITMDEIARHIVWNLNGVTGKTNIQTSGGIFLQPNSGTTIDITGTTAGWIVSAGYVHIGSGEWHHVFSDMPDANEVVIRAQKTVDDKAPRMSQKFMFALDEYNADDNSWTHIETRENAAGSVDFTKITDLTPGWHVFRISETGMSTGTNGAYKMDTMVYYAAVYVQQFQTNGQTHTVAGSPEYYAGFSSAEFDSESSAGVTGNKLTIPAFKNETITQGLSITKQVQGTNNNTKEFKFEIQLWWENEGNRLQLDDDQREFDVTGLPGVKKITFTNTAGENTSKAEITLKNGQTAVLTGLPDDIHYEITEKQIGEDGVSFTEYTKGYKAVTQNQSGVLEESAVAAFINEYKASTKIKIDAHKSMPGVDLSQYTFDFELRRNSETGTLIGSKKNDAEGNISFDEIEYKIDYSQATPHDDMVGAKLKPDGSREKIFTYYIRELENPEYTNIIYPENPVVIKIKVVDDGEGQLKAYYVEDGQEDKLITKYSDDGTLEEYTYSLPKTKNIINTLSTEEYISIGLEKRWTDGNNNTNPPKGASASFTVHQLKGSKAVVGSGALIVQLVKNDQGETPFDWRYANIGDTVSFSVEGAPSSGTNVSIYWKNKNNNSNEWNWEYYNHYGGGDYTVSFTILDNWNDNGIVRIRIDNSDTYMKQCTDPPSWDGSGPVDFSETSNTWPISLPTTSGAWSTTISDLIKEDSTGIYKYYITEDSCTPEADTITFVDENGVNIKDETGAETNKTVAIETDGKQVIATNNYTNNNGALSITKTVLIDGETPTNDNKSFANGTYKFTVNGIEGTDTTSEDTHTVKITFKNGKATKYEIDGAENSVDGTDNSWTVVVDNLKPGQYTVTETDSGLMTLTGITHGTNNEDNQDSEDVNLSQKKINVTVIPGVTTNLPPIANATFRNDMELSKDISIWKVWTDLNNNYVAWPDDVESVTLVLKQKGTDGNAVEIAQYALSKTGAVEITEPDKKNFSIEFEDGVQAFGQQLAYCYKLRVSGLPKYDGATEFEYWFEETAVEGYYPIYCLNNDGILNSKPQTAYYAADGQYIENHPYGGYELPKTGGPGTELYGLLGGLMVVTAGAVLTLRRKKNKAKA